MSQPSQYDYGSAEDPELALVPDSLRVYRHFALADGQLHPMGAGGSNPYSLRTETLSGYVSPIQRYARNKVFVADCRAGGYAPTAGSLKVLIAGQPQLPNYPHRIPEKKCSCGFYAHYSPDTDFYPTLDWVMDDPTQANDFILVKAVVEMSGAVVLGSLGVRAEKMRIKAFTPDWTKYRTRRPYWHDMWDLDTLSAYEAEASYRLYAHEPQRNRFLSQKVMYRMAGAGHAYGAAAFESLDEMLSAYPQPDISHLLPDPDQYTYRLQPHEKLWGAIDSS